jgi:ribosomal protein S18 acetylase RimI-like enzyme
MNTYLTERAATLIRVVPRESRLSSLGDESFLFMGEESMSEVVIRQATRKDVGGILPLWTEMMQHHAALDARFCPAPGGEEHWAKILRDWLRDDDACVLVADVEGQLVGYIVGLMRENPPVLLPPTYGLVSDICVHPAWRQQGLGRRLFEALKGWFSKKELFTVQLNVAHFNPVSQAFWRAMGCEDYMDRLWFELESHGGES